MITVVTHPHFSAGGPNSACDVRLPLGLTSSLRHDRGESGSLRGVLVALARHRVKLGQLSMGIVGSGRMLVRSRELCWRCKSGGQQGNWRTLRGVHLCTQSVLGRTGSQRHRRRDRRAMLSMWGTRTSEYRSHSRPSIARDDNGRLHQATGTRFFSSCSFQGAYQYPVWCPAGHLQGYHPPSPGR